MRILIVIGQGIGNLIESTPLILATANHFKTKVDLLAFPTWKGSEQILKHDVVDNIYTEYDNQEYDLVLETFWGGYNKDIDYNSKKVVKSDDPQYFKIHEIDFNNQLLNRAIGSLNTESIEICEKQYVYCNNKYKAAFPNSVGFHGGSFGGGWQKKRWDKFEQLALILIEHGFIIHNFGNEFETINIKHENYVEYAGKLTLQETINKIWQCQYFVSNDSGLMHVADALNVPLIALFGSTLITKNRPVNEISHVLTSNYCLVGKDCNPCQYTDRFTLCQDNQCLKKISVEDVTGLMKKLKWL